MAEQDKAFYSFARLTFSSSILSQGLSLLLLTVWMYFIGSVSVGIAAVVLGFYQILVGVFDAGLAATIASEERLSKGEWDTVLSQQLVLGIGGALALSGLSIYFDWPLNAASFSLLILFLVLPILFAGISLARAKMQLLYRNWEGNALATVKVISVILRYLVASVYYYMTGALEALVIGIVFAICFEHLYVLLYPSSYSIRFSKIDSSLFLRINSRLWGGLDHFVVTLKNSADVVVFGLFVDFALLGLYSYVKQLAFQLKGFLLAPFSAILLQRYRSIGSHEGIAEKIYEHSKLGAKVVLPFFAVLLWFTLIVVYWLYNDRINIVAPLGFQVLISIFGYLVGPGMYASGKYKALALSKIWITLAFLVCYFTSYFLALNELLVFLFVLQFITTSYSLVFILGGNLTLDIWRMVKEAQSFIFVFLLSIGLYYAFSMHLLLLLFIFFLHVFLFVKGLWGYRFHLKYVTLERRYLSGGE